MPIKVCLISLGCAKNLVNSEQMLSRIKEAGYQIVDNVRKADVAVLNTCAFVENAKTEAIDYILELAELKQDGVISHIIVAGCLSQRYGDEVMKELPEVDGIIGTGSCHEITSAIEQVLGNQRPALLGDIHHTDEDGDRIISTGPGWAYLKIAEGCDNRCAYCVIPQIRGRYRSRSMENIVRDARQMAEMGIREIILVAQDTTRYGTDLYGRPKLSQLLLELCKVEGIEWIRPHYLYPDEIDDELIQVIASQDKIVKYLDLPIQHINDGILKAMNRRGTGGEIRALLKKLRQAIPGLALRTSLIVGLPGEGEAEFEELCDFLREARIERAGVFTYSPEEGTQAFDMPGRADQEMAARRAGLIMELQADIMDEFAGRFIGRELKVICEGTDSLAGYRYGRSYADSPEVDGRVRFIGKAKPGEFCAVRITDVQDGDLLGREVGL